MRSEVVGDRVVLRPIQPADAVLLREFRPSGWTSDGDWPFEPSRSSRFAILLADSAVGFIQFSEITDPEYRRASIDIFIGAPWRGQGYGTDAVRTLAVHLVRDLGHHRVVIDPRADNTAAIRCYTSARFKPVGVMRQYERDLDTGEWNDGLLMDFVADDLKST